MVDPMLKALLEPTNMILSASRFPNGFWRVQNFGPCSNEIYDLIAFFERNKDRFTDHHRISMEQGACAQEFSIVRPTWNEIEELGVVDG